MLVRCAKNLRTWLTSTVFVPIVRFVTSMPAGAAGSGGSLFSSAKASKAVVYDFRRPTNLRREHARVLEMAFETFARQWGTQLTAKLRVLSQATLESVSMLSYDDYVAELPAQTTMVLCEVEGREARTVIQFPAAEALNWVAHMLGSSTDIDAPERPFTRIEQTLVRALMVEALEDLRYSLGSLLHREISVLSLSHQPQFAQAAPKSEIMIVVKLQIRVGEHRVASSVALPADLLLPQLGDANPRTPVEEAAGLLSQSVATVPVEVALSVKSATVKPQDILNLAVGDVLPLGHRVHKPFELSIEGRRLGTAAAGTRGGRIAAVIVSTEENSL